MLLYKRLDNGAFRWPRSAKEVLELTEEQYQMLKIKSVKVRAIGKS
ncbi:MAG: IS66 family insertion sequence element accessory protein TnpB [Lachnospiraceae bacterium]